MAYQYESADTARRVTEGEKGSQLAESVDSRDAFSRDRARVLHSAALRRLADKTQVCLLYTSPSPRD